MSARWRRWCIAAVEAGAGVGFVDAGIAMGWHGEWLPSRGARFVFALCLASTLALAIGLVFTAIAWLVDRVASLASRARQIVLQGGAIALGFVTGFGLFSGTMMRHSPARPWAILATAALFAWIAQLVIPRWKGLVARLERHPAWTALALLLVSAGLYIAHLLVFVRLYPVLHALAVAGSLSALVASLALGIEEVGGTRIAVLTGVITALGFAGGVTLMRSPVRRTLARERAPISSYLVRALGAALPRHHAPAVVHDDRASHGESLDLRDRDVVLITVDALRPDRLGAYGGPPANTPAIDAIAARGVLVERAYCTTPHTSYSLASLMTGKFFREASALGPPTAPHETIAQAFAREGYRTAAFHPPAIWQVDGERLGDLRARGFDFGDRFETWDDAATRVAHASEWVRSIPPTRRLFLWVHLFEPHEPYDAHPNGRAIARSGPFAAYDGEVAAVDDAIGALRRAFDDTHRDALWIVTADHGEEFGEHGGRFHGTTVYEEQVRVPFIVLGAGLAPRRIAGPVSLVDVMPTLLAGLGVPRPARLRGRDLGPELRGAPTTAVAYASAGSMRMVADASERLLCDVSEGSCAWFDLATDPAERVNRADAMSARVERMREWLAGWQGSHARFEAERASDALPDAVVRVMQGDRSAAVPAANALDALRGDDLIRAVHALADLGVRDRAVTDAIAARLRDADASLAREVAIALAMLGDSRGRDAARAALGDARPHIARRAALGLARLGSREGVRVLAAWVTDRTAPDADRDAAIAALEPMHAPESFDAWIALLDDPRLAPVGARALGNLGDRRALDALRRTAETTRYPATRDAAERAIARLTSTRTAPR
jgi:glucan phosphoethanolaminetransferase (alkaline phosphatase superfamily)